MEERALKAFHFSFLTSNISFVWILIVTIRKKYYTYTDRRPKVSYTDVLIEEIKKLPSNRVAEVLDFVEFIKHKEAGKEKYADLSKEDAISMTSDVIEKYRPALEELA